MMEADHEKVRSKDGGIPKKDWDQTGKAGSQSWKYNKP
jgi:hypothetical protein